MYELEYTLHMYVATGTKRMSTYVRTYVRSYQLQLTYIDIH